MRPIWPGDHTFDKINIQEVIMTIVTGAAVSKQKLIDLKVRLLALKEHL